MMPIHNLRILNAFYFSTSRSGIKYTTLVGCAIFSIGLFSGGTFIANGTVTANQIQFTGLNVSTADGTSENIYTALVVKMSARSRALSGNDFYLGFSLSNANTTFSVLGSGKSGFYSSGLSQ